MAQVAGVDRDRLRSMVAQIEEREETKRNASDDIKDLYVIAKSQGLNSKILRRLVKERSLKKTDVEQEDLLLDMYRRSLAGWNATPLAQAAE